MPNVMWLTLPTKPVTKTIRVWMTMKTNIHTSTPKWTVRAIWRLSGPTLVPNRPAMPGACSRPVTKASGAAMNTVMKYASNCSAL